MIQGRSFLNGKRSKMPASTELLWHYTCPHCKMWWSVATSGSPHAFAASHRDPPKCKYCCHCGKPYEPDSDTDFSTGFRQSEIDSPADGYLKR